MLWNIALRTLLCDRGKLLAGLIGVVFSVVLVNVQGGLFIGMITKASLLIDRGNADVWVGSRGMEIIDFPHNIPQRWIHRIRGVPGVTEAEPIRIGFTEMTLGNGGYASVVVIGISPHSALGRSWSMVEGPVNALDEPHGVIVDLCDDTKLESPELGELREIGGHRARIVGKSHGILKFGGTPYIFTTLERSAEYCGEDPNSASYLLVDVAQGTDLTKVCEEIQRRLPEVSALSAADFAGKSINFWIKRTGIGISFGAATCLGLFVGLVMVGQTLYAMVLGRISEFATLKAIGATESELIALLAAQAIGVGGVGIGIGVLVTVTIQTLLSSPRASITIPLPLYLGSALLVLAICLVASAIPYFRVRRVDPHTVLQG